MLSKDALEKTRNLLINRHPNNEGLTDEQLNANIESLMERFKVGFQQIFDCIEAGAVSMDDFEMLLR